MNQFYRQFWIEKENLYANYMSLSKYHYRGYEKPHNEFYNHNRGYEKILCPEKQPQPYLWKLKKTTKPQPQFWKFHNRMRNRGSITCVHIFNLIFTIGANKRVITSDHYPKAFFYEPARPDEKHDLLVISYF